MDAPPKVWKWQESRRFHGQVVRCGCGIGRALCTNAVSGKDCCESRPFSSSRQTSFVSYGSFVRLRRPRLDPLVNPVAGNSRRKCHYRWISSQYTVTPDLVWVYECSAPGSHPINQKGCPLVVGRANDAGPTPNWPRPTVTTGRCHRPAPSPRPHQVPPLPPGPMAWMERMLTSGRGSCARAAPPAISDPIRYHARADC